jgi:CHAD domain-containing protein
VDDPEQAVRDGDELVTQVIEALRQTFAAQRTEFEKDANPDETEALRLALRRYRSFFERLLAM